jgi:hypothetical protein
LNGVGVALALYVFMADSIRAVPQGLDATRMVLPQVFNWPLFVAAFALMTAPVAYVFRRPSAVSVSGLVMQTAAESSDLDGGTESRV